SSMPENTPPSSGEPGTMPSAPPFHGRLTVQSFVALATAGEDVALPCTFGRYRLENLLGKGGMGAVYQAEDTQTRRTVALKIPFLTGAGAGNARARFLSEARSAALLSHPNICPVFDLGEIDGAPYLTMAYVHGKPLARLVGPGTPLEPAQ